MSFCGVVTQPKAGKLFLPLTKQGISGEQKMSPTLMMILTFTDGYASLHHQLKSFHPAGVLSKRQIEMHQPCLYGLSPSGLIHTFKYKTADPLYTRATTNIELLSTHIAAPLVTKLELERIKMEIANKTLFTLFIIFLIFQISCKESGASVDTELDLTTKPEFGNKGYNGYIGYDSSPNPSYGMGVSFYTAAWKLVDDPLRSFQIGLPGTWIIPDNSDNTSLALCPTGTLARTWPERQPTWGDVFQTLEGGLGYWRGNKYRYGPPKFSMNATPRCYDYEVASPGWSFFYDDQALEDDLLGIAQLSNHLLVPPDALTFEGNPQGEFMGYAYMALPFTDSYNNSNVSVGNQSWTCFINTENFKGPIAYYLPETWAKLSESYTSIEGKGLDNRKGINGGAMEINTVPHFEAYGPDGTLYIKVPKLNFPVDENGEALLVQDLRYYDENAIFNDFLFPF